MPTTGTSAPPDDGLLLILLGMAGILATTLLLTPNRSVRVIAKRRDRDL